MAINASSGGQLQGGTGGGGGLTEEDVQDIVAEQIEVGNDLSIGLQTSYDDTTGKLTISLAGGGGTGSSGSISVKENGTARGTASVLNFVGPGVGVTDNVATITGGLDNIAIYENTSNRGNFTSINFVSGATVTVDNGTANVTIAGGGSYTLPAATSSTLGGIKIGTGLSIDGNGVVSATGGGSYTLPVASTLTLGGVKVDGSTITIDSNGVISAIGGGGGISISDVGTYLTNNGYTTTTYVDGQISNLINGAPGALNTLNELAAAIASNPNFASDLTTSLTGKLNISGGTMTGALTLSGAPASDLQAATKKYVDDSISAIPAPTTSLSDLSDVDTSSLSSGQLLGWNGTTWVPTNNTGATGPQGPQGSQGPAGLSITSATVSVSGRLLITLSSGSVVDAGNVAGISSAAVDSNGQLVLTKQDGSIINAGSVIGPAGATGATGSQGPQGDTGDTGIGIAGAVVNGSGRLIITLTDGSTVDAGSSVGPQGPQGATGTTGATGATGPAGNGIFSAVVDGDGNLQITLDDATPINAGSVVGPQGPQGSQGPAGRSIANSGVVVDGSGYLQITLTDGSTINAGYVVGPQGSTGATGAKGDKGDTGDTGATGATGPQGTSYTVNGSSGSVQIYGLASTTQSGYDFEVDLSNKANRLTTARNITLTGKVTGLTSFDGTGNVSITTALSGVSTSDVSEGTRLYYTDGRARLAISSSSDSSISSLISYDDSTGVIKYRANTSYITEGSNLYFTNTRADARADTRIAASSINALSDVDTVTAAPTNGQVLTWTGSAWTPSSVSGGSGAVSSVNTKTGAVVLSSDDITEGTSNLYFTNSRWDTRLAAKTTDNLSEGTTNKYFSNTLARNAMAAGTGLSYNSSTGTFSLSTSTDNVTEGSSNLYYTSGRFDTRLGQSNLNQLADVADTTPTTGQALVWNGSTWSPSTVSGGGGGGTGSSSGVFRASVQVEYDASGNLSSVSVLSGGISAVIATATSTTATVTFTFTGSVCAPLGVQVYGYQRTSNVYVSRALASDFTSRTLAAGGSSGSPSAFSAFDSSVNTMTLSLTKALTGATANVGQTTHCVVQFLLSSS
jgi:hypothetical protein